MGKIIGIIMLVTVFTGLFYKTAKVTSLKEAIKIWGIAVLLTTVVVTSVLLITGD